MKKYWRCASGIIIIVVGFLYSSLFLITDKIVLGVVFGVLVIIGLIIFAWNFDDETGYY